MTVYAAPTEDESYLWAILSDESGLDTAEFCYIDETNEETDGIFRAWPFQWPWFRCEDQLQIDQAARGVGKSLSMKIRALAFPLNYPQEEMVLTAPQGVHLDAVTDNVETMFLNNRLARELLAPGRTRIKHRPFMINFRNGARIIGRIPQHNGAGIKGTHPLILEQDESQDWPQAAWGEIIETFKSQNERGRWRCIAEGQRVLTNRGNVPIEDVRVGDMVITHLNRWRPVTHTWNNGVQKCVTVNGALTATLNHKILTSEPAGAEPVWRPIDECNPGSDHWAIQGDNELTWFPIQSVVESGDYHTYDLTVEEDHSYTVNGIVVSNCHGVTRGVGDGFDDRCKPDSGWTVHRLPAMYRPNWTEEERQQKIIEYGGSVDSVDYRRNVLGLKGDSNSPIFVNFRLMLAVDVDRNSHFNMNEYAGLVIDEAEVRDAGSIEQLLDLPGTHRAYKRFWIGADIGWTIAPTSIVIFAEDPDFQKGKTTMKLLARILMKRVATQDQVAAMVHLIDTYRPQAFAMDSTGAGFPLFQSIQEAARKHPQLKAIVDRIKGYNFSGKVIAEFDDSIKIDEAKPDSYLEAAIMRNVLEHSTDVLRGMVDRKEVLFPYDMSIIGEFLGQTWQYAKDAKDAYGRKRIYSEGAYHTLDACRMAILAYQQQPIEDFIKSRDDDWEPPDMVFL